MDSILASIRKVAGLAIDDTNFDPDIIFAINSAFMSLSQLGIGPKEGFLITDDQAKWSDLIGNRKDLEGVKLYVQSKVRLAFDPPTNSFLVDAIERQIKELEWRLNVQAESTITVVETPTTVEGGV